MKKTAYWAFAAVMALTACGHGGHEDHDHDHEGHDHSEETVAEAEGHDEHEGHDHEHEDGVIALSDQQIKKLGIQTETVAPGPFSNVVKVSGEIIQQPGSDGIVASRQPGIVRIAQGIAPGVEVKSGRTIATISVGDMGGANPHEAASTAYNAAKRELDRITPLYKEGIVTARDFNAALQLVEETRAAMGAGAQAASIAPAPITGVITSIDVMNGQYVDAGQTIATIESNNALSLKAELPERLAPMSSTVSRIRFKPTYSEDFIEIRGSGQNSAPKVAKNGYFPMYFNVPPGHKSLMAGTYCEVYLLGSDKSGVLSVPEKAISEQQGNYFVYVEDCDGHYRKQPVEVGETDGKRREIVGGLRSGDKIVTEGMIFVRLAESSGVAPEGHSHQH